MNNKFESAYKPKILKNWEVPKLNCDRPHIRTGKTKFIANDRGHLLPGITKSHSNPWGGYVGTWRMPKKIDRKTANELSGLAKKDKRYSTFQRSDKNNEDQDNDNIKEDDLEKGTNKENIDGNNIKAIPYVPGDFTEERHRLPSHEELAAKRFSDKTKEQPKGFPSTRDDFSKPVPEPEKDVSQEVENFYKLHREMVNAEPPDLPGVDDKATESRDGKKERLLSPILAAINNFNVAKKLHKENLEHNPLPDTLTDAMYRKLQMQRREQEPGLVLNNKNFATAVGWKGHPGYSPTRCTKLKVFRPKTCGDIRDPRDDDSINSFDKKWRFIRQAKVTPMDLAICWDLTPQDPKDEPKRTTHIDGSNGSAAPAVFSLVHTPKEEEAEYTCDKVHGCAQIFDHGAKDDNIKDYMFDRRKTSLPRSRDSIKSDESISKKRAKSANNVNEADKQSVDSKESKSSAKIRAKSAYNLNEVDKRSTHSKESQDSGVVINKVHQSTPNLSDGDKCSDKNCPNKRNIQKNRRLCMACEMKNLSMNDRRPKSDYKMAFKAGIPQKIKAKRQDYPEHWRLATVYQHSYKPIQARKRPLLQTVFK